MTHELRECLRKFLADDLVPPDPPPKVATAPPDPPDPRRKQQAEKIKQLYREGFVGTTHAGMMLLKFKKKLLSPSKQQKPKCSQRFNNIVPALLLRFLARGRTNRSSLSTIWSGRSRWRQ